MINHQGAINGILAAVLSARAFPAKGALKRKSSHLLTAPANWPPYVAAREEARAATPDASPAKAPATSLAQ